jgi:hypothetical protein
MKCIVITNNPLVNNNCNSVIYLCEASLADVLISVRDKVHLGHRLITHPLSGSVKPGQTPYKSVVIAAERMETTDGESLRVIEDALAVAHSMTHATHTAVWAESTLSDFQLIDYGLIADIIRQGGD